MAGLACLAARARQSAFALPRSAHPQGMGGRGKGYGKGRHGKSRRSFEDDPLACEKKIVNCLRRADCGHDLDHIAVFGGRASEPRAGIPEPLPVARDSFTRSLESSWMALFQVGREVA